jgi:hypothetical protein
LTAEECDLEVRVGVLVLEDGRTVVRVLQHELKLGDSGGLFELGVLVVIEEALSEGSEHSLDEAVVHVNIGCFYT